MSPVNDQTDIIFDSRKAQVQVGPLDIDNLTPEEIEIALRIRVSKSMRSSRPWRIKAHRRQAFYPPVTTGASDFTIRTIGLHHMPEAHPRAATAKLQMQAILQG